MEIPRACTLCPRLCGANRLAGDKGQCGGGDSVRVARAALHMWEEPCISGTNGSGTVFFSGCSLKCCYCQNYHISAHNYGKDISVQALADIFSRLEAEGAHNINLVTATHYLPWVIRALEFAQVNIPIVYNTSGYETVESLELLRGYVDIWLCDLKYYSAEISGKYSQAENYFDVAGKAVLAMSRMAGMPILNSEGLMQRGLIVRHLSLPCNVADSFKVLAWLHDSLDKDAYLLSVMSQYTPFYKACEHKEINRRLSTYEYKKVINEALRLGLDKGYMQDKSSAKEEYTPDFDLEGV